MTRVNRDLVAAIALLVITGVFFVASFDIREPDYGQLGPAVWPRIILGILGVLSLVYLVQTLRRGPSDEAGADNSQSPTEADGATSGSGSWRNVAWCFALFLAYLLALPWLGMLLSGMLFVFLLLTVLGGWTPRLLALHGVIALGTVGGMWALFTYGLGVLLPTGDLTGI